MCDRYSVVFWLDGSFSHVSSNSHSEAVKKSGRPENDKVVGKRRFFEGECNPEGWKEAPTAAQIFSRSGTDVDAIPDKVIRTGVSLYGKLWKTLNTGVIVSPFDGPEWTDVREGVASNANAPAESLRELAKDSDAWVRGGVARNPSYQPAKLGRTKKPSKKKKNRKIRGNKK